MSQKIHPTAIVDSRARLDSSVVVGPYAIVGAGVEIDAGTRLDAHVVVEGPARIGKNNVFFPFGSIGAAPQDKKYAGEPTRLDIGDGNTIREFVTLNRGTTQDKGVTRIGHRNWIMAYVHVAHDCVVGNDTIFANNATLGGHVEIDDWVILGGNTAIHQFCKVGAHAMTGAGTLLLHDLPPYVMASGNSASAHGLNSEGLRRRGFSPEQISLLRRCYKTLYKSGLTLEAARSELAQIAGQDDVVSRPVRQLSDFFERVTRGIVR